MDERVTDYLAGRLSSEEAKRLEAEAELNQTLASELALGGAMRRALADLADETSPGDLGWARLARAMDVERLTAARNDRPPLWRYAAIALGMLALGQPIALTSSIGGRQDAYIPVSDARADQTLAALTFSPAATEAEIRALLQEVDAEIVAGPSALGVYRLRFNDAAARTAAIARFAAEPGIVEMAAPDG